VKDANDVTIGSYGVVMDASNGFGGALNLGVARDEGGSLVGLTLPDASTLRGTSMLVWTSTDCTGAAFITPVNGLVGPAFVDGTTLYYASGPFTLASFASFKLGINPSCSQGAISTLAAPTNTEDISGFVPPYHVSLTP
jgi:hypothetical protein